MSEEECRRCIYRYVKEKKFREDRNLGTKSQSRKETLKERRVKFLKCSCRDFLAIQWLKFRTPNTEGIGSIPGQGTKIPCSTGHDKNKPKTATNFPILSFGEVRSLSVLFSWIWAGWWLLWSLEHSGSNTVSFQCYAMWFLSCLLKHLFLDLWATTDHPEVAMPWGSPGHERPHLNPCLPLMPVRVIADRVPDMWLKSLHILLALRCHPCHLSCPSWGPRHHRADTNLPRCFCDPHGL